MQFRTQPNTQARAAVGSMCHRLNLPGVDSTSYRTSGASILPEKLTLRDLARVCVEQAPAKERANWSDRSDVVTRAMTTSDFSAILSDVSNKQLATLYAARQPTFTRWASPGSLPNFKSLEVCRVSAPGILPELLESDEYKLLTLEDGAETVQLKTFGGILPISRQAIINDDLDALSDRNRLLAQSAGLTQASIAASVLSGNSTLSDGKALFHADRGNLFTGLTSVLSADSLAEAVAAMRRFTDTNGQPLAIEPKFLIVGPGNERLAYQLAYSDADPTSNNAGATNFFKKSVGLEVLVDPLIEASSLTAWYLLPDPAVVPVVRYFTLDGDRLAPYIEGRVGFDTDNLELKTRIDFTAAAVGHFAIKATGQA